MQKQGGILRNFKVDKTWSLFLDRDGIINRQIVGDYVRNWDQFEFNPQIFNFLREMNSIFGRIILVTNQQGVGKNLMSSNDLETIHRRMIAKINKEGGRVDRIYTCCDLEGTDNGFRKPGIGMGIMAQQDYPDIVFEKSIMIGDSQSDIKFGKDLGMITIYCRPNNKCNLADYNCTSVLDIITIINARQ